MIQRAEILLVDDHPLILEGISKILGKLPEVAVVDAVTTGQEAIEWMGQRDYDIYIVDVGLPDMSGFDLIAVIRELNENACIIVNTMHEEVWYINRLLQLGINAVVLKASGAQEIQNAVNSVLNGEVYTCPRFESIRQKLSHVFGGVHPKDVPTKRELEVLKAVARGFSTNEIAARLQITDNTVETFRKRLIQKLGAKNAIDMVVKSMALGWIKIE